VIAEHFRGRIKINGGSNTNSEMVNLSSTSAPAVTAISRPAEHDHISANKSDHINRVKTISAVAVNFGELQVKE
jgi:hypothetical protein